jgi:integrase
VKRVRRFVDYLRECGVVKSAVHTPAANAPPLLTGFLDWLVRHRGLSPRTVERHERMIMTVLPALGSDPAAYDAVAVRRVVLHESKRCGRAQAKTIVTALRVYLRFLASQGLCRPCLDQAVPTLPQWKLSSLPRYLEAPDVERIIAACDTSKGHGVRDRAVLLLLVRLGLRAGDIVSMRLHDIDWDDGTLRVRGKGRREVRLPLPQDAGDALLAYLEHARPKAPTDRVFLCAQAPFRPFKTPATVSDIVRFALRRAGVVNPPSRGANLLRHSAATMMLRSGATLDAIGTVLRHRSPQTTACYAKVDVALLKEIAQPWPEDVSC